MSIQDIHQELSRRVAAAIQAYEDGYEAEQAEYNNELPDFRKRNAALDAAQAGYSSFPSQHRKRCTFITTMCLPLSPGALLCPWWSSRKHPNCSWLAGIAT